MKAAPDNAVVQALLDEQAALRRVATLVATAGEPARVFPIVTEEVGRLLGRADGEHGPLPPRRHRRRDRPVERAGRAEHAARRAASSSTARRSTPKICRSGQPERVDDYAGLTGRLAERLQQLGIASGVGAPIVFDGELWGAVVVSSVRTHAFAPGAEHRIAAFTELVAQALANAEAREQLAASRARVVAAGDGERRRLERNLHDGAQQRLVALAIGLRIADRLIDENPRAAHAALERASEELSASLAELREIARGLHPAVLSDHGLEPAIKSLMQRAPLPVELTFDLAERPPEAVEVAAYYVIAESLTNVAKYAQRVARERRGARARRPAADRGQRRRRRRRRRRRAAPGCSGSRTASRRSAGGCTSRARRGRGRRCAPTCRSHERGPARPRVVARRVVLGRRRRPARPPRASTRARSTCRATTAPPASPTTPRRCATRSPRSTSRRSWSGTPTAASRSARAPADAAGLVYLCAFMLDEGESLLDAMQHELPDWIELDEEATLAPRHAHRGGPLRRLPAGRGGGRGCAAHPPVGRRDRNAAVRARRGRPCRARM